MNQPRPLRFWLALLYAIAIWAGIIFGLTVHWQPTFHSLDPKILDGGQDAVSYVF